MSALTPREARALWIDRLTSSDAPPQAVGRLADGEGRCCLGVACDIAVEHGIIRSYNPQAVGFYTDGSDNLAVVREWFGLATGEGNYEGEDDGNSLTSMNDGGKTFSEIAEVIADEPYGLVTDDE
jgi:hypothetical protein